MKERGHQINRPENFLGLNLYKYRVILQKNPRNKFIIFMNLTRIKTL